MEAFGIMQAFRAYGPKGAILVAVFGALGAFIKFKFAQSQKAQSVNDDERRQLITALNQSTQQTLQIVREELRVQQENTTRFFELLDRNTRAIEKIAEGVSNQAAQIGEVRTQLSRVEGMVAARRAAD